MRPILEDDGEPEMSADDIVAAFRSRKGKASVVESPVPAPKVAPAASPPPSAPLAERPKQHPPEPERPKETWAVVTDTHEPVSKAVHHAPPTDAGTGADPVGRAHAIAVHQASSAALRPAVQGANSLSAQAPALNLSDRLLSDRFVAARGSRTGVAVGVIVALMGLAGYGILRLVAWRPATLPTGWTALPSWWWPASAGLTALGLLLAVTFLFLPRSRNLRIRLAATQREEWTRVQGEAARLRGLSVGGSILAAVGLAVAVATDRVFLSPLSTYGAVGGLAMAVFGLAVLVWAAARRSLVQRLYVQTLVLSRLEQTGLGPAAEADPRVAPVLRSLDKLLGALPESAVRRFLASDEATQYLDLIDQLSGDRHGKS